MIILDAGHGVETLGKEGNGVEEYKFNRMLADELFFTLQHYDFKPEKDIVKINAGNDFYGFKNSDMPLRDRILFANDIHKKNNNKSILISIHADAFDNPNPHGCTIFTFSKKTPAIALAATMQEKIKQDVDIFMRGIKQNNFYILKNTLMPAILIECGFMTNKYDAQKLLNMNWRKSMAAAIADAIYKIKKLEF